MGRWSPVPTAVLIPPSIEKAVLARLSVWFSAALRTKQPDQQPLFPPFAVRLCRSKSARDSRTPSRTIGLRLRLPHQGAKVLPSNSRVRRRRTSSPPQGPPGPRPVGGLRTLRVHQGKDSARIRGRKVQHRGTGIKIRRTASRWKPQCSASSPPP